MRRVVLLCLFAMNLSAIAGERILPSGNLTLDLSSRISTADTLSTPAARGAGPRKSTVLATVMSALLPGAGQAYIGNWWRAAAFFTAEVLGVTAALYYNNAGDKQTIFFQNYADSNVDPSGAGYTAKWDVVKYATWVNNYVVQNSIDTAQATIDPNRTLKPWDRVNWSQLNRLEKEIGDANAATGFSHTLPHHGDQQYYEEIGKYPQYGHGWDDATDMVSTAFNTPHLLYYSAERGKANSLYVAGTWAISLTIVNHLLSAIEAAISSHAYNKTVEVGFRTESLADGSKIICPRLDFHLGF